MPSPPRSVRGPRPTAGPASTVAATARARAPPSGRCTSTCAGNGATGVVYQVNPGVEPGRAPHPGPSRPRPHSFSGAAQHDAQRSRRPRRGSRSAPARSTRSPAPPSICQVRRPLSGGAMPCPPSGEGLPDGQHRGRQRLGVQVVSPAPLPPERAGAGVKRQRPAPGGGRAGRARAVRLAVEAQRPGGESQVPPAASRRSGDLDGVQEQVVGRAGRHRGPQLRAVALHQPVHRMAPEGQQAGHRAAPAPDQVAGSGRGGSEARPVQR